MLKNWLKATIARVTFARNRTLSLIADWLAGALWLIDTAFLTLAKKAYGNNSVAYACVRLLSQSIPEAPLKAYTEDSKGEKTEIPKTHPLMRLIARPNELMTEYEFWELTTIHMAVTGNSYWYKRRNNAGQIEELWPLRPDRVGPIYSDADSDKPGERVLAGWSYQDPGTGAYVPLARRDVLAFNMPNPAGESGGLVEGWGPLQTLAAEISADNEATNFVGALVKNYATPSLMIKMKGTVRNEEEAQMMKAKAATQFGGANRGSIGLVDNEAEVEMIGFNLQQLEFPDLRAIAETRIAAAVGVPAILVGLKTGLDRSTYSNFDIARRYFAETTLSTYWRRYADQFTADVAMEYGEELFCQFDISDVRALAAQRIEAITPIRDGWKDGGATRNEYRQVLGLDPDPNGDVYLVPNNMVEVPKLDRERTPEEAEQLTQRWEPGTENGDNSGIEPNTQERANGRGSTQAAARAAGMPALPGSDAASALRLAADPQDKDEDELTEALAVALAAVSATVIGRIQAGEQISSSEIEAVFTLTMVPLLSKYAGARMLALGAETSIAFDPAIVAKLASDWAKQYSYELVKGITATTQQVIGDAVSAFISNPAMTQAELEAILEPAFGAVRARMIAITENTRSLSAGMDLYRDLLKSEYGVESEEFWRTEQDERVCAICGPLDGTNEAVWGSTFSGGPPAHTRCRCRKELVILKQAKKAVEA